MNGQLEVDGWCIIIRDDRPDYEKKLALMSMREVCILCMYVWEAFHFFVCIFECIFVISIGTSYVYFGFKFQNCMYVCMYLRMYD